MIEETVVKGILELSTIEMFAIKHALQHQVRYKKRKIQELESATLNDSDIDFYIRLKKDVIHEAKLVDKLEIEIKRCSPIILG